MHTRKSFLKQSALAVAGIAMAPELLKAAGPAKASGFEISLAQWSLHRALFSKKIDNLDFPSIAKQKFGISTVEYVNQFFKDKATDKAYLEELLKRAKDSGVRNHLIMIDGEGQLGALDKTEREKAVENHYKWVDAAKFLGCKTIRVNAAGTGTREEVAKAAEEGLSMLGEFAAKQQINVIVENHGGYSSDGGWLSEVLKNVGRPNTGALPDFGNFCLTRKEDHSCELEYDRYKGVKEMMPFAKGVSAKTYNFDAAGNCVETDYNRILKIVKDAGFTGYIGIEYEGDKLGEEEGILQTKKLLERVGKEIGYAPRA